MHEFERNCSFLIQNVGMTMSARYLRHLLLSRTDWMEHRLYDALDRHGYGDMSPAMSRMCGHLADGPLSLSDLARRLTVSRQAVHKLAADTEALGYVEFASSQNDARLKLLRFTEKGQAMAAVARSELEAIEDQMAHVMGADHLGQLKALMALPWSSEDQASAPSVQVTPGLRRSRSSRPTRASAAPTLPARRPTP